MENIMQILGILGIGAILWIVVQHYLHRSSIAAERVYNYQKEELLRYRQIAEKVIEKLMLLENHRWILLKYLDLNFQAHNTQNAVFIDFNNTFDKSAFESNQEQIAALIFLYFSSLGEDWNKCLDKMAEIFNLIINLDLQIRNLGKIDWNKTIEQFNALNSEFGDAPLNLSERIKTILISKEEDVVNQKKKMFIS